MQKVYGYQMIIIDEKTKIFSEEYFQKLYNIEKEKWLSYKFKETDFDKLIESRINRLKYKYPQSILNEVSDIRVLALGYSTKKIYNKIKKYCENNKKMVKSTIEDYNKFLERQFINDKPKFIEEDFHDCEIVEFNKEDNNYIMKIDNRNCLTGVESIIFENVENIKNDSKIIGSYWLYEEYYKVNNKYEVHILLSDSNNELIEFIIKCGRITLLS